MTWEVGSILSIVSILLVVVVVAAMLIWVERRLLGLWQERLGPNRVGWLGLLQVVADMLKIFTKEDWVPPFSDKLSFVLAPTIIMIVVLMSFSVIPFAPGVGVLIDVDWIRVQRGAGDIPSRRNAQATRQTSQ